MNGRLSSKLRVGLDEGAQQLGEFVALSDKLGLGPNTKSGNVQPPVILRDLTPSSGLCRHYTHRCTNTRRNNKINL